MKIQPVLLLTALLILSAGSAEADTYYFTGAVTDSYLYPGQTIPVGALVSGDFSITLANAQTITGQVGSANWSAQESGGTVVQPNAPPTVFSVFNFNAPGFSYSTLPSSESGYSASGVSQTNGAFSGYEGNTPYWDLNELFSSSMMLSGFPGVTGSGRVEDYSMGNYDNFVAFTVSSVAPVATSAPEVDPVSAASAITLLFGGLIVLRGRRTRGEWQSFGDRDR